MKGGQGGAVCLGVGVGEGGGEGAKSCAKHETLKPDRAELGFRSTQPSSLTQYGCGCARRWAAAIRASLKPCTN